MTDRRAYSAGERAENDRIESFMRGARAGTAKHTGWQAPRTKLGDFLSREVSGIDPGAGDTPEETPAPRNLAQTVVPAGEGVRSDLDAIRTSTWESFDYATRQAITYGSPEASAAYDQAYTAAVEAAYGGGGEEAAEE